MNTTVSKIYKTREPSVARRLQKFALMQRHFGGDISCSVMNLDMQSIVIAMGEETAMREWLDYAERWLKAELLTAAASESEEMGV